jgi:hypothetical protein
MRVPKGVFPAVLFLGMGSGLWACMDQTATGSRPPVQRAQASSNAPSRTNPYAFVGTIHNQALDYAFREIKRSSATSLRTGGLTKDDYFEISETSLREYFSQRRVGLLRAEEARRWREAITANPRASARELAETMTIQEGGETPIELSSTAWDYLNEILLIADGAQDMSQLDAQLSDVETRAAGELTGTDLEAVYATASVTRSSAIYWEANYDQWASLCTQDREACTGVTEPPSGNPGGAAVQRVNGWKVLAADVVGCIGGFLVGAWPGCAVTAGVASVNSVIGQA